MVVLFITTNDQSTVDTCRHYSGVSRETSGLRRRQAAVRLSNQIQGFKISGHWEAGQKIKGISINIIKPKCFLNALKKYPPKGIMR